MAAAKGEGDTGEGGQGQGRGQRGREGKGKGKGGAVVASTMLVSAMDEVIRLLSRLHFPVFEQDCFFCEIQESVGFLRNPQDFKISCRKTKNVPVFDAEKRFRF